MAEYIEREALFPNGVFFVNKSNPMTSLDELINRIWNATAADVVPVVRCKDCKHNIGYEGSSVQCDYWLDLHDNHELLEG